MAVDSDFPTSDQSLLAVDESGTGDRWQQQVDAYKAKGDYVKAAGVLAQAIEAEPQIKAYYWQLGLMQLLAGAEDDAQVTWMFAMTSDDTESSESNTQELVQLLEQEAQYQENVEAWSNANLIRQYIDQLEPNNLVNLLALVRLGISQNSLDQELLINVTGQLSSQFASLENDPKLAPQVVNNQILQTIQSLLGYELPDQAILDFIDSCLPYLHRKDSDRETGVYVLLEASGRFGFGLGYPEIAISLAERCLNLNPDDIVVWSYFAQFYQNAGQYEKGLAAARTQYEKSQTLGDRLSASHMILRGLLSAGGYWQESQVAFQKHMDMIAELVADYPLDLGRVTTSKLLTVTFFVPYLRDQPAQNRPLQNQLLQLCVANVNRYAQNYVQKYANGIKKRFDNPDYCRSDRRLKIGYLSSCLRQHSVGWLARWLIQNHDRDRFELYGYFLDYRHGNDPLQEVYVRQMDHVYLEGVDDDGKNNLNVSERIFADGIDILIDLDSITLDSTCEILATRPAPLQVTWLGLDASGLPTIDYFIADPYSLPDDAQSYYSEKIWRLPRSFIAVDGFEAAVPTLNRRDLHIPETAIVYLTAQSGVKRHPDTIRMQLEIIKAVPNSYLAIKGFADQAYLAKLFGELAQEVGVSSDRLVFLPLTMSEAEHRANLTIADVVLDTYPYNGATTTLETLWMGIPIVTRVGKQFSARNAYALMMNAGIEAGIAWSDREYIEWGIKFGTDQALRQQVCWQLRQSRHSQPLWDSKQFTQDMEAAYVQMWQEKWQSS
jgi:predicted O-linked N-acetylglucosamine transferase (SPINDLY family)